MLRQLKTIVTKGSLGCAALACVFAFSTSQQATAQTLRVEVENLGAADDFFITPLWVGLHNGSFDLFDVGSPASPGLEEIAETGSAATLMSEFAGPGRLQSVAADPAGFGSMPGQPPVIDPGNTAVTEIDFINPSAYRYFSFASMLIPSNDAFIGNGNPTAYELFDAGGNFIGPQTINLTAANIYDSGTELNNAMGAAFSALGGTATDTLDNVTQGPDLSNFIGTDTAAGTTIAGVPGSTPFVQIRITQVPEPTSIALAGMGVLGLCSMVRRRRG